MKRKSAIFDNFINGKLLSLEMIGEYQIFFKPFRRERILSVISVLPGMTQL